MKFVRNEQLLNELLLVDGVGRSGKVILAEILTCFDRVEKQEYHEFLEYVPLAYKYGKIDKDIAISILKTQMDTELYNGMIGRKVNARPADYTSIYKYHSLEIYLERQALLDGPAIAERVLKQRPIYMCWSHDLIQKSDLIFDAFADKVRIFYINRRPIDIIYEWNKKNFGNGVGNDPTEMHYIIESGESVVPEFAYGWEGEYLSMNPFERVVKMIHTSFKRNYEALVNTDNRDQVMIVDFEELVTEPRIVVDKMGYFINSNSIGMLKNVLERENCPRVLGDDEYLQREQELKSLIAEPGLKLLEEL